MHAAFLKRTIVQNRTNINEVKQDEIIDEILDYKIITDILDYNFENKVKLNKINNIILSFTAPIDRFISDDFLLFIEKLYNQELPAKYIFINIYDKMTLLLSRAPSLFNKFSNQSNKENIENRIKLLTEKYNNLFINMCDDLGPIIKILGLYNLHKKYNIDENDKIIVIDSDCNISPKLTLYYELCYEIYNCEFIGVNYNLAKKYDDIFFDNLNDMVSSTSSYSIKYKYLNKLYDFAKETSNIKDSDDLVMTLFYRKEKLYSCGINLNLTNKKLDNNIEIAKEEYFNKYDLLNNVNDNIIFEINNCKARFLLSNILNLNTKVTINDMNTKHCSISYFNNNIAMITITSFQTIENNITLLSNNKIININNLISYECGNKHTYFIKINIKLEIQQTIDFNFNLFQTDKTNLVSRNKFYSISTLLNYIPYLNYVFYNNETIIDFIKHEYPQQIFKCYNMLNIGAYKADFFRVLYIYKYGGLYFNCKNILYNTIYNYLLKDSFYVRDSQFESIHNGILYNKNKLSELYFNYIISIVLNIIKKNYTSSSEEITGSKLLYKIVRNPVFIFYKFNNKLEDLSEYIVVDKKILICCSYYNYYYENNYLLDNHHMSLWSSEKVFNDNYDYDKVNFIDHIAWINLDKSTKRHKHMTNLLKNIKVPSTRISAVDGTKGNLRNTMNSLDIKTIYTSNPEIGCTLSHIKAISHLSTLTGNYFLVLEDDVTLDNLCLFDITLKDIIETCPSFDILQIHGITEPVIPYAKTIESTKISKKDFKPLKTWSTAAYIISRKGIENFMKRKGHFINNKLMIIDKNFDIADIYTYRHMAVYSYKYNFFSTQEYDSDIHTNHLESHIRSLNHNLNRLVSDSVILKLKNGVNYK
jgi:GR25 family glycosyltransferase involved in LPS biosynthesis